MFVSCLLCCGMMINRGVRFPFTRSKSSNVYCVPYSMDKAYVQQGLTYRREDENDTLLHTQEKGGDVNAYPTGLAKAPVSWDYHGKNLQLQFIAGFIGYQQDAKSLEICPNLGWCIVHEDG